MESNGLKKMQTLSSKDMFDEIKKQLQEGKTLAYVINVLHDKEVELEWPGDGESKTYAFIHAILYGTHEQYLEIVEGFDKCFGEREKNDPDDEYEWWWLAEEFSIHAFPEGKQLKMRFFLSIEAPSVETLDLFLNTVIDVNNVVFVFDDLYKKSIV